ncbi:MAG: A/G-specific adenine glycosylase [Bacteroidales bacterium]|nr:MAG: A/G-specific adenine glycosylase [Bacteroidales bacterium]
MDFKNIIIIWYNQNRRDLPWRNTENPYYIWIAEVILQQTRVAQGLGYYNRFISTFPTIKDLANADIDKVMKVWQGLGYYTRARNLHGAAKQIMAEYNGLLPTSYQELLKIKGLGPYSAGAIASFAFKLAVPAIDGNVYRVLSRIFGVFASPETSAGKKEFYTLTMELIDKRHPDTFNQALLDFGAMQCVPRSPNCLACPFNDICYAYRNNLINQLPLKGKRIATRDRFLNYIIIRYKDSTFIQKREAGDIWTSLYEFPLIETANQVEIDLLIIEPLWSEFFGKERLKILHSSQPIKHILSHQTLYTKFIIVEIDKPTYYLKTNYLKIPIPNIQDYSIPKVIDNFLAAEPSEKYLRNKGRSEK